MWLMMTARNVVIESGGEIVDVDPVILRHLDEDGLAIRMHDGRGHGGEGEGRDQDPRAGARSSALRLRKIAAEQEETASAYFDPIRSANSRSSKATGASSGAV